MNFYIKCGIYIDCSMVTTVCQYLTLLDIVGYFHSKHYQAHPSTSKHNEATLFKHYQALICKYNFLLEAFLRVVSFVFSHQREDCPGLTLLSKQRIDGLQTREYSCLPPSLPVLALGLAGHILQSNIIVLLGCCCLETEL